MCSLHKKNLVDLLTMWIFVKYFGLTNRSVVLWLSSSSWGLWRISEICAQFHCCCIHPYPPHWHAFALFNISPYSPIHIGLFLYNISTWQPDLPRHFSLPICANDTSVWPSSDLCGFCYVFFIWLYVFMNVNCFLQFWNIDCSHQCG